MMAHRSRAKGDQFERDVVAFLRAHGHRYVERAYGAGRLDDHGDIDGIVGWTIQCRNRGRLDLAGALDDAERQRTTGTRATPCACAILKRRGRAVRDAYVVMTLAQFTALLADDLTR